MLANPKIHCMRNEHNPHIQTVNPKTTWWPEHWFNFVAWLFGYDWFNVRCLLFVLLVRYRTLHEACRHVLFPDPHYGNKESKERFRQLNPHPEHYLTHMLHRFRSTKQVNNFQTKPAKQHFDILSHFAVTAVTPQSIQKHTIERDLDNGLLFHGLLWLYDTKSKDSTQIICSQSKLVGFLIALSLVA